MVRLRFALLASAALALACGGDADPGLEAAADPVPAAAEAPATAPADSLSTVTLLGSDPIPNGSPMPPAEATGGVPAYPNAVVWNRSSEEDPGVRSFEAFTADPVEVVRAFYDRRLPEWRRVRAEDTDIWSLEPDRAAVTVTAWDWEHAHPSLPPLLREEARTVIGVAWRTAATEVEATE